ncbi:MAG: hypothetical protein WCF23_16665 [Candidatus Nitrosopolaris sp.]
MSESPYSKRAPVSTEILSSAYNTASLHSELNDILLDASTCDYYGYVDNDGMMHGYVDNDGMIQIKKVHK